MGSPSSVDSNRARPPIVDRAGSSTWSESDRSWMRPLTTSRARTAEVVGGYGHPKELQPGPRTESRVGDDAAGRKGGGRLDGLQLRPRSRRGPRGQTRLFIPGAGRPADATVAHCGEREREAPDAELESCGEHPIADGPRWIHSAADGVGSDPSESESPPVAFRTPARRRNPRRRAGVAPHDAKCRAVDLETDSTRRVMTLRVDGELDEDQRCSLGTQHRTSGSGDCVDGEPGARRDAGASQVDDVVGGAPSARLAARDQSQRSTEHADALRLGATQPQCRAVDRLEQPAEDCIALLGCGEGANHQAHAAHRVGDGARTGSIPLGGARDHLSAGVDQSRAEGELGDLGQGEIHASMSGAAPSVTVTVSRYLRLP